MARDEQVQSAIDNWAPRFVANGVDSNDFQRVTSTVERWDDWCAAWSETGAMHEHMGEQAEAEAHYESAAYHYFHAAISYHFGKYLFVHKPQELRAAHEHVVHDYQRALPYFEFPGEHVAIPYEGGATMYGVLRKPWHTPKPPVVILVPGLDSVKEELHTYGDDFPDDAVWRCWRLMALVRERWSLNIPCALTTRFPSNMPLIILRPTRYRCKSGRFDGRELRWSVCCKGSGI